MSSQTAECDGILRLEINPSDAVYKSCYSYANIPTPKDRVRALIHLFVDGFNGGATFSARDDVRRITRFGCGADGHNTAAAANTETEL